MLLSLSRYCLYSFLIKSVAWLSKRRIVHSQRHDELTLRKLPTKLKCFSLKISHCFCFSDQESILFTIEPRHEVVLPGTTKSIVFQVNEPLTTCRIKVPNLNIYLNFNDGPKTKSYSNHFRYYGNGLANGECGLTVYDVTEDDNEWVIFDIETNTGKRAQSTSLFPVASKFFVLL